MLLLLKIGLEISFLTGCYLSVRYLAFSPSGHICQSWSTITDIWLIGRQGVVDRLPTPTDCWRIPIIILQRVEVKGCKQEVLRDIVGADFAYTSFSPDW